MFHRADVLCHGQHDVVVLSLALPFARTACPLHARVALIWLVTDKRIEISARWRLNST